MPRVAPQVSSSCPAQPPHLWCRPARPTTVIVHGSGYLLLPTLCNIQITLKTNLSHYCDHSASRSMQRRPPPPSTSLAPRSWCQPGHHLTISPNGGRPPNAPATPLLRPTPPAQAPTTPPLVSPSPPHHSPSAWVRIFVATNSLYHTNHPQNKP